jgi:hypothetical protein
MRPLSFGSVYLGLGVILGYASALYMIAPMGSAAIANSPGWSEWQLKPDRISSTYSLARFLSAGEMPPPLNNGHRYFRATDAENNKLRPDCVYRVKGALVPARWWSFTILSGGSNTATATSILTSENALTNGDGSIDLVISRYPQSGNWLRPPDGSDFSLHYTVSGPSPTDEPSPLPTLTREGC